MSRARVCRVIATAGFVAIAACGGGSDSGETDAGTVFPDAETVSDASRADAASHGDPCQTLAEGEPCSFTGSCVRETWDYYMGRCGYFVGYCEEGRLVERDETYGCMVPTCGSATDSASIDLVTPEASADHLQSIEVRYVGVWCDPTIRMVMTFDPIDGLPPLEVRSFLPYDLYDREEPVVGPLLLDAFFVWEGGAEVAGQLQLDWADVSEDGRVSGELTVDDPALQLSGAFDVRWCSWDICT